MIKALIVGLGSWGQTLVNSIQGKSDKIKAVYGLTRTSSEAAQKYAKEKGLELLTCPFEEAIARDDIDAVILASPHSVHRKQVELAAAAGKHIASEKPFTLNKADAVAAIEAAKKAGVTLAVLHNRRFNPVVREIQRMVKAGELGTISHVEGNFSGDSGLKRKGDTSWRMDREESPLGSMTGKGLHVIDAMVSFCGPIEKVFAHSFSRVLGGKEDTTACLFWFKQGMTGYLGTLDATTTYWSMKVFGTKGTAEMRGWRELVVHPVGGKPEVKDMGEADMERAELEAFADAVNGVAPYPMTYEEMPNVPAFLESAIKSNETGQPVMLP
ncbi:MAG: Gfo/Idh/MocA family oxidoreductase [Rhodospirillales bacterium]